MITENSAIYSLITLQKADGLPSGLRECFQDLQRVQGAPSYLLLMYLLKNRTELCIDDDQIAEVIRMLVNFFVRRSVTDIPPTRDLTRLFMAYIEEIEQNRYTGNQVFTSLRAKLLSVSASDDLFAEKLRGPIYDENSGACRFILCSLAQRGMTNETYVDLWRQYDSKQYVWSIEHIFPQGTNIPQPWVDMIAGGDPAKAREYQTLYVHTFGNLTITGYNSALSNKSFSEKRDRKDNAGKYIGYRNGLNLNADVADKGRQSYQGWMFARLLAFSNGDLQSLYDRSNGFYRRQLILTTRERPPDRVDDPDIAEKMCRELEGIFLWAFEGLQRLVANHFRFTESVRARSNRETVKQDANNVLLFMEAGDYIRLMPEGKVGSQELYEIYTVWCRENGFSPLKNRSFSEFLIANQKKYHIEHSNNLTNLVGRRVWGFTGIEPVLKLPLRTSDGWQRDYSDDNPFI